MLISRIYKLIIVLSIVMGAEVLVAAESDVKAINSLANFLGHNASAVREFKEFSSGECFVTSKMFNTDAFKSIEITMYSRDSNGTEKSETFFSILTEVSRNTTVTNLDNSISVETENVFAEGNPYGRVPVNIKLSVKIIRDTNGLSVAITNDEGPKHFSCTGLQSTN